MALLESPQPVPRKHSSVGSMTESIAQEDSSAERRFGQRRGGEPGTGKVFEEKGNNFSSAENVCPSPPAAQISVQL